jgi:hypothetical protein
LVLTNSIKQGARQGHINAFVFSRAGHGNLEFYPNSARKVN